MCSVVEYYGEFGKSSCGYCKGQKTSESAGMTGHFLSVEDYQDLVDRGWRRSGKYCYKPSNKTTCCPSYTIKCSVNDFVLSKSHKKILKTMNKFLKDGIRIKDKPDDFTECEAMQSECVVDKEYLRGATRDLPALEATKLNSKKESVPKPSIKTDEPLPESGQSSRQMETSDQKDQNAAPLKKKKLMRLERRQAKLAAKGLPADEPPVSSGKKTVEDFLNEEPKDGKHKLKVTLTPSDSPQAKSSFDLYKAYQMTVHHDPPGKLKPESFQRFLCISPLKEFKSKHGPVEFELYTKYQVHVHNDKEGAISDFYSFLVDSPLKPGDTETEHTLGSFHQQYWLDDKLIAVAVLDLLPHCLSSVYFFYDPEYSFLSLGTYSSLREVAFTQQLQKDLPDLRFYYMGFYIHSCPKMRYKAKLSASYLLCPEVYTWHAITEGLLAKLDATKYSRFNEDPEAKDTDDPTQDDLKRILMFNNGQPIPLEQYLRKCKDSTVFVRAHQYAKYVGRKCARRIVLYL